jgi:hypothetical protein
MQYVRYIEQIHKWPNSGKHILANYDSESISVYQAYNPNVAEYAIINQKFGGSFSYSRMSWIKPNFLWMMYRSGWATKQGQDKILEIRISRTFFDEILEEAVVSNYNEAKSMTNDEWRKRIEHSDVRLQWDPDHAPNGNSLERRAIQLGLRGKMLERYGKQEIIRINDITEFVIKQRNNVKGSCEELIIPLENVYIPNSENAINNIVLDRSDF